MLSFCQDALKRPELARTEIDRAIALQPAGAVYWSHRSTCRLDANDFTGAFDDACHATTLLPTHPLCWLVRALAAVKLERFDEVDRCCARSLELSPSSAPLHRMCGDMSFARTNYPAAIARYQKAIALQPDERQAVAHCRASIKAATVELEKTASEQKCSLHAIDALVRPVLLTQIFNADSLHSEQEMCASHSFVAVGSRVPLRCGGLRLVECSKCGERIDLSLRQEWRCCAVCPVQFCERCLGSASAPPGTAASSVVANRFACRIPVCVQRVRLCCRRACDCATIRLADHCAGAAAE
jgi:hypothetical protein